MPDGAPPSLEQAFGSLNYTLKKKVDVCASKAIPYDVSQNAKGQVDDSWSPADIEQALLEQCDEMLPALLAEQQDAKKEEAAKKKEEKEKKKEEAKKKKEEKAAADKQRKEEAEKKRQEDKIKREEAAAKKKEDQKKAAKEREKKLEEDKKRKKEADKKRKEEDKQKAKEKAKRDSERRKQKAADDKVRYDEKEKQRKENSKKNKENAKKREEQRKIKEKENKVKRAKTEEKRREQREEKRRKQQEELEKEWNPEDGIDYWEKDYTEDTCCNEQGFQCCRSMAYVTYFLIFPPLFGLMVFIEYEMFGWARFAARFAGEGYNLTDFNMPSPAPLEGDIPMAGAPTPEPVMTSKIFFDFVEENPLTWGLPVIGMLYGTFANIVPMCPGLVLVPLFQELGVTKHAHSTVALVASVQMVGSGVLGFTAWCGRDARFFICRALFLLTPCAWLGYIVGVTNNLSFKDMLKSMDEDTDDPGVRADIEKASLDLLHTYLRMALGVFMCVMSLPVFIGLIIGGVNRICCPSKTGGSTPGCKSFCQWIIAMGCSFNTGYVFTATIGSGMGMFTFFVLSLFLGVETKRAMPTAIVIGGWTQILPVFFNMVFRGELPYIRLMTMIPGMWLGTLLAPWWSHAGGPQSDLAIYFMCLVSIGVSTVIYGAIKMDKMKEDVDINIDPMFAIPALDELFADDEEK